MTYRRCVPLANLRQKHVTQFEERCLVQTFREDVREHVARRDPLHDDLEGVTRLEGVLPE